jgi:hypothetical protein
MQLAVGTEQPCPITRQEYDQAIQSARAAGFYRFD